MMNSWSLLLRGPRDRAIGLKFTGETVKIPRIQALLAERPRRQCLTKERPTGSLPEGTKARKHEWRFSQKRRTGKGR